MNYSDFKSGHEHLMKIFIGQRGRKNIITIETLYSGDFRVWYYES